MSEPLTVENFITKIKAMSERERNKIRAVDLINLIVMMPEQSTPSPNDEFNSLNEKINGLVASVEFVNSQAVKNSASLQNISVVNNELKLENESLKRKVHDLRFEVNSIEQYLRVDNVEVVGLPEPEDNITDEIMLLEAFNSLDHESDTVFTSSDIDICHVIPSKRTDGKRVVVCKFMSRKIKHAILKAKKDTRNLKYKYRQIYINEHLAPENRRLFALASAKKKLLVYKYLWTKNGSVYIRKSDKSSIINITCDDDINNLT